MTKNKMIEAENIIMKESLIAMRKLGGKVTRKDIRREIRDHSEVISEKRVDEIRTSKKTGNQYHPFEYDFNFAIKHLILAEFINTDDNHTLELAEKGRSIDLEQFDAFRDVRALSEPKFPRQKKTTHVEKITETVDDTDNDVDEPWRQELLNALAKMNPHKFELFCRGLLKQMGIDIDDKIGVQYIADGGLDGFGYVQSDDYRTTRVALQAKRWRGKVSAPEIDKFRGAMDKYNAEFGIFITNSDFTREAINTAKEGTRIITLINGDEVCNLVAKYQYYVEEVVTYRLKSFYTDFN